MTILLIIVAALLARARAQQAHLHARNSLAALHAHPTSRFAHTGGHH